MTDTADATASRLDVPPGACDCHTHVFLPPAQFPFFGARKYTPPPATVEQLSELMSRLRVERVVVVQPSVYGTDNSATLHAIRVLGQQRARGVAVIDGDTSDAELDRLAQSGVRGVRVNLELSGVMDPARSKNILHDTARRIAGRGWHIQIYSHLSLIVALSDTIATLGMPVVLDHFAGAHAAAGVAQPGFDALLDLLATGHVYVKLSAAYRCSARPPHYADVQPIAQALIAANADRMVWGSDWPHPDPLVGKGRSASDVNAALPVDDIAVFELLRLWAPDADVRRKILVDNPARLYGFV
jgi:predicted TIM-barrel fold metal-dependent hydrolase